MDLNTNSKRRGRLAAAALVPVLVFGGALTLPLGAYAAEGEEPVVVQEVTEEQPTEETPVETPDNGSGEGTDQGGGEEIPGETPVDVPDEEEEAATAPNSIRDLNASSSNGALSASWSAPEDNGVATEGYSIYLVQTQFPDGAPGMVTFNFSTPDTGFTRTDLPAGTWTVYVTAHNYTNQTSSEPTSFEGVVVIDTAAPVFTVGVPGTLEVWPNQDINLYVELSKKTPADLTWEFRSAGGAWMPIVGQINNNLNLASGLPASYDGGQIRAVATNGNSVSYSTTTIKIKPIESPSTVEDLRIEDNVIYWTAPASNGGAEVTVYRVIITGPNGVETFDVPATQAPSFARMAFAARAAGFSFAYNFIPGEVYSVQVLAGNESGFGAALPVDYEAAEDIDNGGNTGGEGGNGSTDPEPGTDNGAPVTGGNVSGGTGAGSVADAAAATQPAATGSATEAADGDLARTGGEAAGNVLLVGALALLAGFGLFVRGRRRATA